MTVHTLHFSIKINAPREHVWDVMLADETFRLWSSEIGEGSHFVGSWEQGSNIKFLDANNDGVLSRIAEDIPYECITIENYGIVKNGVEETQSEDARLAAEMSESYTFTEANGITEVSVRTSADDEYKPIFEDVWPEALSKLKALCE